MFSLLVRVVSCCCLLLVVWVSKAQTLPDEAELSSFYDQLNAYSTEQYQYLPDSEALLLPSTFSGTDLQALQLQERHIVRIDLVYSAYHLNPAFNQRQLNIDRIRKLALVVPGLLHDETITWTLVEQTGCHNPAECQTYFHGFVVYVARHYTAATSRAEVDSLKRKLRLFEKKRPKPGRPASGKKVACNLPTSQFTTRQMARRLHRLYKCPLRRKQIVRFQMTIGADGRTQRVQVQPTTTPLCVTELEEALRQSVVFAAGFRINRHLYPFNIKGEVRLPVRPLQLLGRPDLALTNFALSDSAARLYRLYLKKKKGKSYCEARITTAGELLAKADTATAVSLPPDANVVARVMNRHSDWQKDVVVADVTGSMYPYSYDLLAWLQLTALQSEKTFVFFNDGNDAADKSKSIGKTGGLHHVRTSSYAAIKQKLLEAMLAGGGGDAPENDAEALLYARQLATDSTDIILIADNATFPRDTRLLKNARGHVRIILCGVFDYINPRYLALARQHGFSVHTIEADIMELSKLLEGETITIQGQQYLVTKHGFKLIRKT